MFLDHFTPFFSPYSTLQSTTSPSRKSMTRLTNVSSKQHRPPKPTAPQAPQAPAPHLYTPAAGSPPAPTLDPGQPQGRQEVMRPVTLTLPLVLFPKFSLNPRQRERQERLEPDKEAASTLTDF